MGDKKRKKVEIRMEKMARGVVSELLFTVAEMYGLDMAEEVYDMTQNLVEYDYQLAIDYLNQICAFTLCDDTFEVLCKLEKTPEKAKGIFFCWFFEFGVYVFDDIFLESLIENIRFE